MRWTGGQGISQRWREFGGKDPTYVCADVNPIIAADSLADGAMYNAGQSCCSVERIYVHASVYDAFIEQFIKACSVLKMGDPLAADTTLGPLTRGQQMDFLDLQIKDAREKGAEVLLGGGQLTGLFRCHEDSVTTQCAVITGITLSAC